MMTINMHNECTMSFNLQLLLVSSENTFPKENHVHQCSRLTFQLSSQVASERFDFTSQNKFSLARLFFAESHTVFNISNF